MRNVPPAPAPGNGAPALPAAGAVAACLRAAAEGVLARWAAGARATVAAAHDLDDATLRNSLPEFLANLAAALADGADPANLAASAEMGREHGRQRAALPGYGLDAVLVEYRLLRHALFGVLHAQVALDAATADVIHDALDRGIGNAAATFVRCRDPDGRTLAELFGRDAARAAATVADLEDQRARREDFVATLCHDLRQPLAAVSANAQVIAGRVASDATTARLVQAVQRNVGRIDRMLRDLLDANRLAAGAPLPLAPAPCDLRGLAAEVLDEAAAAHGDRFVLDAPVAVEGVWSADALRRVLENLVGNAVKHGDPGVPVRVTLAGAGDAVTFAVHNAGPPIPPDQQAVLFNRFRQSLPPGGATRGGWGLGLFLVRGVVAAHGGSVAVDSRADIGTTFTVRLPRDARPFLPTGAS